MSTQLKSVKTRAAKEPDKQTYIERALQLFGLALQVLTPILVVIVGSQLSHQFDEAKLRTEQIDVASKLLNNLFADSPEPARVVLTIKLMGNILGKEWKNEITTEVIDYYMTELLPKKTGAIVEIMPLKKRMAIQEIHKQLRNDNDLLAKQSWDKKYYIVVEATSNKDAAIARAKELQNRNYVCQVYQSKINDKYYAITIGYGDLFYVLDLLEQAQRNSDARADAYLTDGSAFQGTDLLVIGRD
jgi:hypothetical protein